MRRLLTFDCEGETLAGTLDEASGTTGILMVTGGSQTRIGSHRMYERLAKSLAERGYPCFRFDRRGVGDSSGADPGYLASGPDIGGAAAAFGQEVPALTRCLGLGLCDGATALALHGAEAGVEGIVLINPWFVEAEADAPPPAAIRSHYRQRLLSREGWKKLLSGDVKLGKLAGGLRKAAGPTRDSLAEEAAAGLRAGGGAAALILASGDNTAIAAAAEVKHHRLEKLFTARREISSDSHTFARPGDEQALFHAVLEALTALDQQPARPEPVEGRQREA